VLVYKWARKLLRGEGYWVTPYEERGLRREFAETLRWIADKIGPEDAFSHHGGLRFANRLGVGQIIYVRPDESLPFIDKFGGADQGVHLWYRVSDYREKGWEQNEHAGSNPRPR
jgi:hypothetical protein